MRRWTEERTSPNERILPYSYPIQLSRVLKRVAERAGIKHGNKKVRFHCLHKFLTDRLSSYMSESKWKQIVGKTISEFAYVSPDSLREDYKRVMVETTFAKAVAETDIEIRIAKRLLEAQLRAAGIDPKKILRLKKVKTDEEAVKAYEQTLEESKQQKTATNGGCQNGNCQRIVSEEELPSLLVQGWRVSAVLPSGRVVISNEALS